MNQRTLFGIYTAQPRTQPCIQANRVLMLKLLDLNLVTDKPIDRSTEMTKKAELVKIL